MTKRRMLTKKYNYRGGKKKIKMSKKLKKTRKGGTKSRSSSAKKSHVKTPSKVKKIQSLQESRANLRKLYKAKKKELDQIDDELISNDTDPTVGLHGLDLAGNLALDRRNADRQLDDLHNQIIKIDKQIKRCEGPSCVVSG